MFYFYGRGRFCSSPSSLLLSLFVVPLSLP
jgi:hypothetical protein